MAIGADRTSIIRQALRQGLGPVLDGLVLGLLAGFIVRMFIRSTLVLPVPLVDATGSVLVAVPLAVAALAASIGPALRAARTDPNVALREL